MGRAGHHSCHQLPLPHSQLMAMAQSLDLHGETLPRPGGTSSGQHLFPTSSDIAKSGEKPRSEHQESSCKSPRSQASTGITLWDARKATLPLHGALQPLHNPPASPRISARITRHCHQPSQRRPGSPSSIRELSPPHHLGHLLAAAVAQPGQPGCSGSLGTTWISSSMGRELSWMHQQQELTPGWGGTRDGSIPVFFTTNFCATK